MASPERKRPFYLMVVLLATLALGSLHACHGWGTIEQYRDGVEPDLYATGITHEADRTAVANRAEAYAQVFAATQARGYPLAVAELLLGAAVVFFSVRAMSGSSGARGALVQLVIAQAVLGVASFWLLRDVDRVFLRMVDAKAMAITRDQIPDRATADQVDRVNATFSRAFFPALTVIQGLSSALIVVALTRRRSRDFFDAAAALEER